MKIDDEELRRIGYFCLFFVCLIIVTILVTLASYLCSVPGIISSRTPPQPVGDTDTNSNSNQRTVTVSVVEPAEPRSDQTATVCSYQSLLSSKGKLCNSSCSCCSICLMDYKESDLLRVLAGCGHFFHVTCVDPWLRMNLTCPVCRRTPI